MPTWISRMIAKTAKIPPVHSNIGRTNKLNAFELSMIRFFTLGMLHLWAVVN